MEEDTEESTEESVEEEASYGGEQSFECSSSWDSGSMHGQNVVQIEGLTPICFTSCCALNGVSITERHTQRCCRIS